jgi:hypothetical protein
MNTLAVGRRRTTARQNNRWTRPQSGCKQPAKRSSQAFGDRACRNKLRANPDECDPQPMWKLFVAQRWHSAFILLPLSNS